MCLDVVSSIGGFIIEIAADILLIGCGVLVLLVLGDKIVQVRLGFREFHFIHTLASVPMKESLTTEHHCKLIGDTLPSLLNGGRVSNKDTRHFESLGWDVTNGSLEVVRDPLDEVRGVLVDHLKHLVVDFLARHGSTEHHSTSEVTSVTRISGAHHVLSIKGLLGELRHRQDTESLRAVSRKRSKSDQEEVKTREGNHVHSKLSKIAVELTWETKGTGRSGDGVGNQVVEVAVGRVGELEGTEANVVQRLVVESVTLISVLDKLVDGKSGVVGLDDSVRDLGRWDDTVRTDDTVGVFLLDLGDEKSTHTRSSSSSHRVGDLETLENITTLTLLAYTLHDGIYEFCSFGVVTLGPVISSSTLSKDKVVGTEKRSVRSSADRIHGSWFQIGQDGTWDISSFLALVEVHIDASQLKFVVANVFASGVNAMLSRHDLPELGTDLVTTLASLDMDDFSHLGFVAISYYLKGI
mmetsp:Transcript_22775/g.42333  ORF Transcript_22775/g.42333 Transcript_22775/m.42333 type:complete len:467 (+) Transcript_22775:286-1686(+)